MSKHTKFLETYKKPHYINTAACIHSLEKNPISLQHDSDKREGQAR